MVVGFSADNQTSEDGRPTPGSVAVTVEVASGSPYELHAWQGPPGV